MSHNRPCDIFISYSKDSGDEAAKQLSAAIEKQDLQPFAFDYTLRSGDVWSQEVLDALRFSRCVLVLVPASDKKLTDYMNHEIGIAHMLKKKIVPVALGGDFSSSAPMTDVLRQYWGCPFDHFLNNLGSFIKKTEIRSAMFRTIVWSQYLVSDSACVVVGGIDPAKLQDQEQRCGQGLAGDYFSIGVFRATTRLSCFFLQQFGADFIDKLLIAQKVTCEEISRHDLIVIGGPISLQGSPLQTYHKDLRIDCNPDHSAYVVGPRSHQVTMEHEAGDRAREGCVLAFARNPMNYQKEMLLVSGISGYGCQGAIEYLIGNRIDEKLAKAVDRWRSDEHYDPLLFELSTEFRSNTYVKDSGKATQINADPPEAI